MTSEPFDETRLDDPAALESADESLRHLAEAGSRVRQEAEDLHEITAHVVDRDRPRAVVAAGADARLVRAVLEPWCPVPFVAWPGPGLPGWVGPLDVAVVLAPGGGDADSGSAVQEAVRRGTTLVLGAPVDSPLAERAQSRHTVLVPAQTGDRLALATVVLQILHAMELGPEVTAEEVAGALDTVAERCSPYVDLATNPAKDLALVLADALPLVWGGSVLAARAGRRVAETLRRASGRPSLAADHDHLLPVLEGAAPRDPFADPFADPAAPALRPALFVIDDGNELPSIREARGQLLAAAEAHDIRVSTLRWDEGPEVARYAALQSLGTYAAVYLAIGLHR